MIRHLLASQGFGIVGPVVVAVFIAVALPDDLTQAQNWAVFSVLVLVLIGTVLVDRHRFPDVEAGRDHARQNER